MMRVLHICYIKEERKNNSLYLNGNIFFQCDSACLKCVRNKFKLSSRLNKLYI